MARKPIATRELALLDASGVETGKVTVSIYRPTQCPEGEWECAYRISALPRFKGKSYVVHAFDAVQALQGVMMIIGGTLEGTDEWKRGRLRWEGGRHLGFPSPKARPRRRKP